MRALAVNPDVVVIVSAVWQTTATAVRSGSEGFLIDSPVLPDEVEALPAVLEQAGFPLTGLLCTHGDWDHLLARGGFPQASVGVGAATFERLETDEQLALRELREFDEAWHIEGRVGLDLSNLQSLPVPGVLSLGDTDELDMHAALGHTSDGTAFWMPWLGVLVCGDYLSPVEIPMISPGGSAFEYLETLKRLAPIVEAAGTVVPGHGHPRDREDARRGLAEDLAYIESLLATGDAPLPASRSTDTQRRTHVANQASLG
jgi:glyoxylase-like metal-dependent hydrolase (beta-lactamase superfamily II)